ncbi:MAG: sulfatase [Opitutaceae bacterium]|nr:sulfatase [Opitutaceae bacterium]
MKFTSSSLLSPCLGALLLLVAGRPSCGAQARPNVLFVVSDDLSSRISPAGYPGMHTPVLDRLAKESVAFRNAYCQYPVCGPSRASFLSGLYPESTGVLDNVVKLENTRPGTPTLPGVFRQAGYWTAAVGKVFHKPLENPGDNTWDESERFENDELPVERAAREAFEAKHGSVTAPRNRIAWREHALTLSPLTRNQGVKGLGPGYGPTGLTDEQHADGKNARRVASWITSRTHGDRPFLIACGFHKPHIPFLAPDAYFKLYPKSSLPLIRPPSDDWSDIPAIADTKQYLDYGFPSKGAENEALRREFTQAYYACISFIDAQLGLIIDALQSSGQWENTIIVFIGDHGYLLGEHFMWGKVMLFEESSRTPMLVRVPALTRAGRSSNALVELVDLFPTLAELCGVTPPAHLQGRSLVPLLRDPAAQGKNHAYTVVRRGEDLGRSVRFDRWRYTEWGPPGQSELYNLATDPNEWTNLARVPEHAGLVRRAAQLLAERRAAAAQQRAAAK